MTFKREIERKYVIKDDVSLYMAHSWLRTKYKDERIDVGISADKFWVAPHVDFIRLRTNTQELTVKITDKDTIEDRVEENLVVEDLADAERWATAVFGAPVGSIEKLYYIYYVYGYTVSLYTVTGRDELYLEIEADSISKVKEVEAELSRQYTLEQEHRSLFQIVFGDL